MSKYQGFGKVLEFQLNIELQKDYLEQSNCFFVINHPTKYCNPNIILLPKTDLKRKELFKTIFLKTDKMNIAGFRKSSQLTHLCDKRVFRTFIDSRIVCWILK